MDSDLAVEAFQALGHQIRMRVFRLLVHEGPGGLPAGKISEILNVAPSTLSSHLHVLKRAGLLISSRHKQRISYAVDIDGTRRVLIFLTQDCCKGRPEICAGLTDLSQAC